jgi:hypothetical protein
MKAVQYFDDDYLERCREMTPDQIIQFLDDFRKLHGGQTRSKSKLISIAKAALARVPYQTQIKTLMKAWVISSDQLPPDT